MRVGSVECRMVVGAIEKGSNHVGRLFKVAMMERGG